MDDKEREETDRRRMKIFMVSQQAIADLLSWREYPPHWIELPAIEIPNTAEIVAVNYNNEYQCFDIITRHESFDSIPPCEILPRNDSVGIYSYKVKVDELFCDRPVQADKKCQSLHAPTES